MKITFTPSLNNKINKQTILNKNNLISNTSSQNYELPKSSMAEVLGRVQAISFKGINTVEGSYVEHTCTERNGINGITIEHIIYDKKTGNYTHKICDKDDVVIRREDYYPSKKTEIITTYDKDGTVTIEKTSPDKKIIEKYDSENRKIYVQTSTDTVIETEQIDYKRGRKVIDITDHDIKQPTMVVNLETGNLEFGDLAIDRIYDKKTNTYITQNIVTKAIHKKEIFDEQGDLKSLTEYNPTTGSILIEKLFDNGYEEHKYTGETENKPISSIYVSADGLEKEVVLYAQDGETVINHEIFLNKKNGTLGEKTIFNANNIMIEKIYYGKEDARTRNIFDETTTKRKSKQEYNRYGELTSETIYYPDGKSQKGKKVINKDGTITLISYNQDGIETQRKHYDSKKQLELIEIYDTDSNSLAKTIAYDIETGNKTITTYEEEYETPYKEMVVNKDGAILSQTIYHADGKTPEHVRKFNKNRSYIETSYDENGRRISQQKYNADGTKAK